MSLDYFKILKDDFNVKIAGKGEYEEQIERINFIELPYSSLGIYSKTKIENFLRKIKEILNFRFILNQKPDILILQSCSIYSVLGGLFLKKTKTKIYLIQYKKQLNNKFITYLYNVFIKNKIESTLLTQKNLKGIYSEDSTLIPDYFLTSQNNIEMIKKYEFCIVGIINKSKKIEEVIEKFIGKQKKIVIAGKFESTVRYQNLKEKITPNIKIINKFLSREEYYEILNKSKYLILPYGIEYNLTTSGVVYDGVLRGIPVIGTRIKALEIIEKYKIGCIYENFLDLNFETLDYKLYRKNISKYLKINLEQKNKFIIKLKKS